jgi:2-(1,2-epoxy-1,2-dihydrophenyl)acetyl-CoA isomerase
MDTLRCERNGEAAWIVVDRPPINGMIPLMVLEMYELVSELSIDPSVRIVVLTGSGGAGNGFLPGADLNYMLSHEREGDATTIERDPRYAIAYRVPAILHEMPAVTIAAINGAVAGAGLGWALGCDFRVAATSARFNTAFLSLGVAGDMGLPWSLSRVVGGARARELCFFPKKFTAADAEDLGLVSAVFEDHLFDGGVREFVETLLAADATALRTLKANFVSAESSGFQQYLDVETARHFPLVRTDEAREGFARFLKARRQPTG